MDCRECHQQLSPAEALRYDEEQREFEDFEHRLAECTSESLEDVVIPDGVAPDVDRLTPQEDGTIEFPTAWLLPVCDRCQFLDCIQNVLYEWDAHEAYWPMVAYARGHYCTYIVPQSPVMACSWAFIVQQWYEGTDDTDGDEYREALQLLETLWPSLPPCEKSAAVDLTDDIYDIARAHGAIWVPDPNPKYLAALQRALVR